MKKLLTALILSTSLLAFAQNEGTLRLYLTPPAEAVTIDGELMEFGNSAKLKPGKYFVQAWCPNKAVLDTVIEIKAGEILSFFYRFENNENYISYLEETKAYVKKRNVHVALPVTATAISAGALIFTYFKGKQLNDEADAKYLEYKYAGVDIAEKEAEFNQAQDKYRNYYYAQFVEYAALAVSSYFLYKGIRWLKQNPKPELEKDKNPFKVDQVGFMPNRYGGYGVGLTIALD